MIHEMENLCMEQEGFVSKVYKDSLGYDTIGFGFLLSNGVPREVAEYWFTFLIQKNRAFLLGLPWFADLDIVRQGVIENMTYNMGFDHLFEFRHMIEAIQDKNWTQASTEMLSSVWANQVGNRAVVLAKIMETGLMP